MYNHSYRHFPHAINISSFIQKSSIVSLVVSIYTLDCHATDVNIFPLTKIHKLWDVFLSSQCRVAALVVQDDEDVQQGLHAEGLPIAVRDPSHIQITQFSQSLLCRHHNVERVPRNRRISECREESAVIPCFLYTRYGLFAVSLTIKKHFAF